MDEQRSGAIDYEADSLRGRLDAIREQMNALLPGYGALRVGEFDRWFAERRDEALERFWRS